jgi:hypothetical protein
MDDLCAFGAPPGILLGRLVHLEPSSPTSTPSPARASPRSCPLSGPRLRSGLRADPVPGDLRIDHRGQPCRRLAAGGLDLRRLLRLERRPRLRVDRRCLAPLSGLIAELTLNDTGTLAATRNGQAILLAGVRGNERRPHPVLIQLTGALSA